MSSVKRSIKHLAAKSAYLSKPLLIKRKFIPQGWIKFDGDKSIAHRALILSALSDGLTLLKNFPIHDDSLATLNALTALGVKIIRKPQVIVVYGCGKLGLKDPHRPIFVNNSGTTLRLLLGVLAGMNFKTKVLAGADLSHRPMSRVNVPLRLMGARITARIKNQQEYAPIVIRGGKLKGIIYHQKVASAQVKSAILLAGLFAKNKTKIFERLNTRDHTERMLKLFGANIVINNKSIVLNPNQKLASPGEIYIPGDISSAAFFIVLATIIPKARISIEQVGLNPSRLGLINVLKRMRAKIKVKVLKQNKSASFEPRGSLIINSSRLKGVIVSAKEIPLIVDELPILMVAACFAEGSTVIKGVSELRVKETDRINSMVTNLKKMGANIQVTQAGGVENIIIYGQGSLRGAKLKSFGDHRTAMSMVVAALAAEGDSSLDDISCVSKSFPGFLTILNKLSKR